MITGSFEWGGTTYPNAACGSGCGIGDEIREPWVGRCVKETNMKKLLIAFLFLASMCGAQTLTVPVVSAPSQYAFSAARTSAYSLTASVFATGTFTVENYDIGGNFNETTGIFTVPVTGWYAFQADATMAGDAGASSYRYIAIGVGDLTNPGIKIGALRIPSLPNNLGNLSISKIMYLTAGDLVLSGWAQGSSGALNVEYANFSGYKLP